MSKALADLMERNLLEVFGQVDSARRAAVIAELYTADCRFFEAGEQVTGREAHGYGHCGLRARKNPSPVHLS
jgi:hypothetical protein